jgi:hypothetical protein
VTIPREDKAEREAKRLALAEGRSYLAWRVPKIGWRVEPRMTGEALARADKATRVMLATRTGQVWQATLDTLDVRTWTGGVT